MEESLFEWDAAKDAVNFRKHGVSFMEAQAAFLDPQRIIADDTHHSRLERRYHCMGKVDGRVMTVRFTWRGETIRIIGAGYWRKGRAYYEKENQIHR